MIMDRGQQQPQHPRPERHGQQQPPQTHDAHPSHQRPRSNLSRSISYPVPAPASYSPQIHDNMSASSIPVHRLKDDQSPSYAGLGISLQSNDNPQSHPLPSPDSPFGTHLLSRYGTGQPPTPSFPALRSSSPASSVWSTSDQGTSSNNLSGFIPRLHKMVSDEKYQHLISWNASGTSFFISRVSDFASTVLPLHFKHNNFSSFVRQLNMYGFHKVNKTPRGYKVASENQVWEFSHTKFIRHRPDLLDEIKRRQGDIDYIREGDLSTHMNLMQVQQNDFMKQLAAIHDQLGALVNGLNETRLHQANQEERLKNIIEYLEKQTQQPSPASSQSSVKPTLQRKLSLQKTSGRRPSNVARLVLDESIDRRYSLSTTQDLDTFFEGDPATGSLGTPPQSSPPVSQPSSSGSGNRSPIGANSLRAAPIFSTPSSLHTPSTQYTPASSFSSLSSIQRTQAGNASPTLRRNKSMVMPTLPSPNVTPTPSYNYPSQYTQSLATIESESHVLQQEMNIRPHTSHAIQQSAQPPATYQSAAAPYSTPPRLSQQQQQQYTTPQFQPAQVRQDPYAQEMQLASPASFNTNFHSLAQQMQQQQQQQRRRRQNSDVAQDMDLGS